MNYEDKYNFFFFKVIWILLTLSCLFLLSMMDNTFLIRRGNTDRKKHILQLWYIESIAVGLSSGFKLFHILIHGKSLNNLGNIIPALMSTNMSLDAWN